MTLLNPATGLFFQRLKSVHSLSLVLFSIATLLMSWVSWKKWPDLIIDFGREAYIPWQISQGQVLYKDMHYIYGPLSSYIHAALFKIFGPGILVLALFNIFLVFCLSCIIYLLFIRISDTKTATLAGLAFICVFAFSQHVPAGNYNFICPYSYELTHGIFLGFLSLWLLSIFLERQSHRMLALSGCTVGLTFLTKPEVFLAVFLSLGSGLALYFFRQGKKGTPVFRAIGLYATCVAIPPALFIMYFSIHMPVEKALFNIFNPWLLIFNPALPDVAFFNWVRGTDTLSQNFKLMTLSTLAVLTLAGLAYLISRKCVHLFSHKTFGFALALILFPLPLVFLSDAELWFHFPRCIPIITAGFAGYLGYKIFKTPTVKTPGNLILLFTFFGFSLLITLKIFFNVTPIHYGFALSLPGTLALVFILVYYLPTNWVRKDLPQLYFKYSFLTLFSVFSAVMAFDSIRIFHHKSFPVGQGVDQVYDYPPFTRINGQPSTRGMIFQQAMDYVKEEIGTEARLLTLPDTIMFNYMTGNTNAGPILEFSSGIWILTGEKPLLDNLKSDPPDGIVFVERNFFYFGYPYFGKDYAMESYAWIQKHYTLAKQFGATPFAGNGFGIQILKRNYSEVTS